MEVPVRNLKSPIKNTTLKKNVDSTGQGNNSCKENVNDYEITSEVPIVRGVDCHPDDWVFQKREKAKVSIFH